MKDSIRAVKEKDPKNYITLLKVDPEGSGLQLH